MQDGRIIMQSYLNAVKFQLQKLKLAMRNLFFLFSSLFFVSICPAQLKVQNLLTKNLSNPVGIDSKQPRFSWQLISDKRNTLQTAYEIKVSVDKNAVWSSGKVSSDQSVQVPYKGSSLQSAKKYQWQVREIK